MFGNLFSPKGKSTNKKGGGALAPAPAKSGKAEAADEEFQLLSLHRRAFAMTPELERRRAEEQLRKQYDFTPYKSGSYL